MDPEPETVDPDPSMVEALIPKPVKAKALIPVTHTGLSLTLTSVEADSNVL